MVAIYSRRLLFEELCKNLVLVYNKSSGDAGVAYESNHHLGMVSCATYIIFGGFHLRNKQIALGKYPAGIASIEEIGAAFGNRLPVQLQQVVHDLQLSMASWLAKQAT